MNKFKKILLGTLSVLTLGLFVVTGARVNAATINVTQETTETSVGNTYVLNASQIMSDFTTINGSTTLEADYGIFTITGSKWILKNNNKNLVSNGVGNADNESNVQNARILIKLQKNQKLDWTINAIATTNPANASIITINGEAMGDGTFTTKFNGTNYSGSYNSTKDNDVVSIWFKQTAGFISISASISNSNAKHVYFFVDGEQYANPTIIDGTIEMPTTPTKEGCTFNGWINVDGTEFSNSELSGDMNVYADFTRNELTATYSGNPVAFNTGNTTALDADYKFNDNFTIKATSNKKVNIASSSKNIEDGEFTHQFKFGGDGSIDYRSLEMKVTKPSKITIYAVASGKEQVAPYVIVDKDNTELLSGCLPASNTPSIITFDAPAAGSYYLYGKRVNLDDDGNVYEKTVVIYGAKVSETVYTPNITLSVDANSNNTKVRVVASIDNLNIVSEKLSGITSMTYTIDGKTWSKEVTNAYTSVDNASSGFYKNKDYTAYAIVVFSGYDSVTTDFNVTFTVELSNGQTVAKTITVPAHHAAA